MSFNFRRSIKLAPGLRLNVGKTGVGFSAGVKGFHVGVNSHGQCYTSAGIPGTGLTMRQYTKRVYRPATPSRTLTPLGWFVVFVILLVVFGLVTHVK